MKNNRRIYLAIIAGITAILIGLTGCDEQLAISKNELVKLPVMDAEKSPAVSFDAIGGKDFMPIGGYHGPYTGTYSVDGQGLPNYVSEKYYEMVAQSGVNLITLSYTDYLTDPKMVIKSLELCKKYNIGMFVFDKTIMNEAYTGTLTTEKLLESVSKYSDYPAFCGLYIVDEPTSEYYKNIDEKKNTKNFKKIFEQLNQIDIFGYINLFPLNDSNQYDSYIKYIEQYIEYCSPRYISWDNYVFDSEERIPYFQNLDIIRKYANKQNIPFWAFIQAGGQWNDGFHNFDSVEYFPDEGEMNWNVGTSLAFGAQGIQYFPLLQPYYFANALTKPFDFERNSLIGAMGNKNRWYYYAQAINKQVAAIDEVLMNAVNKGVLVSGAKAQSHTAGLNAILPGQSWRQLNGISGDALIGCFNYNGKTALYVVNYDMKNPQSINLDFTGECNITMIQMAETSHFSTDTLTLDLNAGEGVLLIIE